MAQPTYFGTILREGASGPDVALVQKWLNAARNRYASIPALDVDGNYGPATQNAVRMYQRDVGLSADGTVGVNTWNSLYDTYASMHGAGQIWPGITIREGDKGAVVKSAQIELKKLVPHLALDGSYGPDMRNAVFAFQVVHNLSPDGVLGKRTWDELMIYNDV